MIEMIMGAQVDGKLVRQNERKHLPHPDQVGNGSGDKEKQGKQG